MLAKRAGNALWTAIDRDERAAGRIVVWVEADAEVSTAMIRSLFHGDPRTALEQSVEHVGAVGREKAGAVEGLGGERDDHVDQDEHQRREEGGHARVCASRPWTPR